MILRKINNPVKKYTNLSRLKSYSYACMVLLVGFVFVLSDSVSAQLLPLTQFDVDQLNRSQAVRDPESISTLQCGGRTSNSVDNSKVFFIGDSITVQMINSGLLTEAKLRGFNVDESVEPGSAGGHTDNRRWGPSAEAIGAFQSTNIQPYLAEHAQDYANAGIIVVGLGTNRATNIDQELMIRLTTEFVNVLRSNNSSAQIFWVNTVRRNGSETNVNNAIAEAAARSNFTVLDFASEYRASLTRNEGAKYPLADSVHHTTSGNQAKAGWILDQIIAPSISAGSVPQAASSLTPTLDVTEAIGGLSEDQKIAQTFIVGFTGAQRQEMIEAVEKYKLGGVFILGNDNGEYNKAFFDSLNAAAGIPLLVASDEEGGRVQRFREQIGEYPSAKELGEKSDAEIELVAKEIGEKLLDRGVNTVLAPVADLSVEGSGAVFDLDRGFSEDPAVVKAKASAFAKGLRSAGVNPTYKHFPGLGTTPGNTDNEPQTSPDIDTLRDRDLLAFEDLVNSHNGVVMLNNAVVPGLTSEGEVIGTSAAGVRLLREELGFEGIITTDDLKAGALASENSKDTIAKSLAAGATMPLFNFTSDAELQSIIDEVKSRGISTEKNLVEILQYKNSVLTLSSGRDVCNVNTTGNNEADVFRILTRELGFTREQAAGVIANMRHESSVEPMRLQGTPRGTETPSSTVDITATSGIGWGLVQWTPTGKIIEQSSLRGVTYDEIDTIPYQLRFLDGQLRGTGFGGEISSEKTRAGDPFFASTTVEEAASIFAVDYERCADCQDGSEEVRDRINEAIDILAGLGSQ